MKNILLALISLSLVFSLNAADYKVMDRSSKRAPKWINSMEKEYLIVTTTAATLEDAKAALLTSIKQQIAESVASRVISETNLNRVDIDVNGKNNYQQQLKTNINSKSAKLPFMNEISMSKVEDFYWEKRAYKKSNKIEIFYAVKYPFSDFQLKELVMEYQLHEKKLDEKLETMSINENNFNSIEDIDKALSEISSFAKEFDTSDPRQEKLMSMSNQYRKLYDYITLEYNQPQKGVITATLKLKEKIISTHQKPMLRSNCATKLNSTYEGNLLYIKYDDYACYDVDENYIEIRFKTGNKYLVQKVYIKL
jgi:hypothetical protein